MSFVYIIFFLIFNIFIVFFLKRRIEKNVLLGFILFLIVFFIFHFSFSHLNYLTNESFFNLITSSLAIIVFYFLSMIPILFLKKKIDFENHLIGFFFNLLRIYIIPVFVTISQVIVLINQV